MNADRSLRWLVGLACFLAAGAAAAEWKFPSLFREEKTEMSPYAPSVSRAEDEEPPTSGFKFPKLSMPKFGAEPSARKEPSTMQKLGQGTKNFFSKTADVLTPWDNDEKPKARTSRLGSQRRYNGSPGAAKAKEEKSSWVPSWFSDDEEPKTSESANGFLSRPRPRF